MEINKVVLYISKLSVSSKNNLFALWMSKNRIKASKEINLLFALDDECNEVYQANRKNGFMRAELLANEHILNLFYGQNKTDVLDLAHKNISLEFHKHRKSNFSGITVTLTEKKMNEIILKASIKTRKELK